MDPKVYGKLLTHHRRGRGVDVEALRDRFPLWQSTGKDGISRVQKVAAVEIGFRGALGLDRDLPSGLGTAPVDRLSSFVPFGVCLILQRLTVEP